MIVVDEYLALRVLVAPPPPWLGNDELGLPTSRHWRILQAMHHPRGGQLSRLLAGLEDEDRQALRHPSSELMTVIDPRPLLDDAAVISARFSGTGWLTAETLAAGVAHGRRLFFATEHNVGLLLARAAAELGVAVEVLT